MRSFTHARSTHTRGVSLSLVRLLSRSALLSARAVLRNGCCACVLPPFLLDKGGKERGKGREQIQFIFNIIFIVAAARDEEPKNRTEPHRTVPYRAGNQSKSISNSMRNAFKGFSSPAPAPAPSPAPTPAAASASSLCCLLCSSS